MSELIDKGKNLLRIEAEQTELRKQTTLQRNIDSVNSALKTYGDPLFSELKRLGVENIIDRLAQHHIQTTPSGFVQGTQDREIVVPEPSLIRTAKVDIIMPEATLTITPDCHHFWQNQDPYTYTDTPTYSRILLLNNSNRIVDLNDIEDRGSELEDKMTKREFEKVDVSGVGMGLKLFTPEYRGGENLLMYRELICMIEKGNDADNRGLSINVGGRRLVNPSSEELESNVSAAYQSPTDADYLLA